MDVCSSSSRLGWNGVSSKEPCSRTNAQRNEKERTKGGAVVVVRCRGCSLVCMRARVSELCDQTAYGGEYENTR